MQTGTHEGEDVDPVAADAAESITSLWGAAGDRSSGRELAWAIGVSHNVSRQFGRFFENHDVLITPTCAAPPLPLGTIDMGSTDLVM
ncbi:MAG: hypothetical protein GXP35_00975 [Actinobacteria bacterium]|nr:hypothetical protein [Actinomycetota bacterium]